MNRRRSGDRKKPDLVRQAPSAPQFTEEQLRMVELVAKGWTNHRIADELRTSVSTLARRLREVARSLGADSRVTLVARAAAARLIDLDSLYPEMGRGGGTEVAAGVRTARSPRARLKKRKR